MPVEIKQVGELEDGGWRGRRGQIGEKGRGEVVRAEWGKDIIQAYSNTVQAILVVKIRPSLGDDF